MIDCRHWRLSWFAAAWQYGYQLEALRAATFGTLLLGTVLPATDILTSQVRAAANFDSRRTTLPDHVATANVHGDGQPTFLPRDSPGFLRYFLRRFVIAVSDYNVCSAFCRQ